MPFGLAGFDSRGSHSKKAPFAILKESALLLLATGLLPRRWPLQRQRQRQRLAVANNHGPWRFRIKISAATPKYSKFSVENRTQSHAPQHTDARHSCWGPLRVVSKLSTARRHGFRRDLTRFRMKISAAAQNFRNFRSKIARNLTRRSARTILE